MESGTEHGGPDNEEQYNSLIHEIGCCVREKVPMLAAKFSDLDYQSTWEVIYNYLSVSFSYIPNIWIGTYPFRKLLA